MYTPNLLEKFLSPNSNRRNFIKNVENFPKSLKIFQIVFLKKKKYFDIFPAQSSIAAYKILYEMIYDMSRKYYFYIIAMPARHDVPTIKTLIFIS